MANWRLEKTVGDVSNLQRIYPITARKNPPGPDHLDLVRLMAAGGAKLIQIREKELPDRLFLERLLEIREVCTTSGVTLIVNDRVDLALAARVEGVHLGQDDLPVDTARRLLGPDAIIGISTHNLLQFETAIRTTADYIAVGPIFDSPTKRGEIPPLGCPFLRKVCGLTSRPVVAIGGIHLENVAEVWESGASSAAVISDVVNSPDPARRVRQYLQRAQEVRS